MLEILAVFAILLVLAIIVIVVLASKKPNVFHVESSTVINAGAEKIHPLIENLGHWKSWSPFEKLDPNMKKEFTGPECGVGAVQTWEGNSRAGAGRLEVIGSTPNSQVLIKLNFYKPFKAENQANFSLVPEDDATKVTWSMEGPNPFPTKVMRTLIDLDGMLVKDFAEGLANLKKVVEA